MGLGGVIGECLGVIILEVGFGWTVPMGVMGCGRRGMIDADTSRFLFSVCMHSSLALPIPTAFPPRPRTPCTRSKPITGSSARKRSRGRYGIAGSV